MASSPFSPAPARVTVSRERVTDQVATHLTERIAHGSYAPGELLPSESELAAQFSVGKSAIREAVKIVAARGMLQVQQGYGTLVLPRDRWNLHDPEVIRALRTEITLAQLVEARRILEPEIAAMAAVRATSEDLERIRPLAARIESPTGSYESSHALQSLVFHEALAEATGNPVMGIVFSALRALVQSKVIVDPGETTDEEPPYPYIDVDHTAIFAAIEARDPERARELSRQHLQRLGPYWRWVSRESGWD